MSSTPIREKTADQNRGRSGSRENKKDAQVSRDRMEKLLSGLSITKRAKTHFSHRNPEHEFKWVKGSKAFKCEGCKQDGWGARYECRSCVDSHFHKECMEANPRASNEFTGASFKLLAQPKGKGSKGGCKSRRKKCNACGKLVEGLVYYSEKKDIALHPRCFELKRKISAEGITFHLRDNMAGKGCACCGGNKDGSSSSSSRGWSYVSEGKGSEGEGYHIHVYCAMKLLPNNNKKQEKGALSLANKKQGKGALSLANKKQRKGAKFLKIMLSVLNAIAGILFGNPAPLLWFAVEQLLNL